MVRAALVALALTAAGAGISAELGADLVPDGWSELPPLAAAVPSGHIVKSRRAYGEPSQGVYLFVQEVVLPTDSSPENLLSEIGNVLASKGFRIENAGPRGQLFELGNIRGQFRIRSMGDRAQVTTCFYNERTPEVSKEDCEQILERSEKP